MTGRPDHIRLRSRGTGRPVHPPFTDFPLAGYVFAAAFDLASAAGGSQHQWSRQLWHAGTFVLVAGLAICLITMGTGFADLIRYLPRTPAAVRLVAGHICVMAAVFMVGAGDLAWRLSDDSRVAVAPPGIVALSVAAAIAACAGAFLGGKLVFAHGVGVAPAGPPELAESPAPAGARQPPGQPDTLA